MRWVAGTLAVCALAGSALTIAGSGALASGSGSAETPTALAKRLAASVATARTDAQRYRAVLGVMEMLHMGVFTPGGRAVVRGGKPYAVHLYDFEVRAIAAALGRRDTYGASQIAERLSAAGVKPGDGPLTAERLQKALAGGTRAARARPRDPLSLVPLLARELGLRQRPSYDLATAPVGRLRFDALQTFLIGAEVAAAALGKAGRARALSSAASPCNQGSPTDAVADVMPIGKWGVSVISSVGSKGLRAVAITLDLIHGSALAFSVRVSAKSPELQETHYGPAGHRRNAGEQLRFRVLVEMLDDYPEVVIECGALIGMKFPKKGPIPGVRVLWQSDTLQKHGSVAYDPAGRKTGPDGIGTLFFKPKSEKVVGFGLEKSERGVLNGIAFYQSAFGNIPGTLVQFLVPKYAGFAWEVLFHKPRGFKFSGLKWLFDPGSGTSTFEVTHARRCGDDPSGSWAVILYEVSDYDGGAGPGNHYRGPRFGRWTPGQGITGVNSGVAQLITPGSRIDFDPKSMQVRAAGSSPGWTTLAASAPVTEDINNGAFDYSCEEK